MRLGNRGENDRGENAMRFGHAPRQPCPSHASTNRDSQCEEQGRVGRDTFRVGRDA